MRKLLVYVSRKPVEYSTALQWQRSLLEERTRSLRRAKALGAPPTDVPDALLLLEHTPVYTLGRSASEANVLFSRGDSGSAGVTFKDDRALRQHAATCARKQRRIKIHYVHGLEAGPNAFKARCLAKVGDVTSPDMATSLWNPFCENAFLGRFLAHLSWGAAARDVLDRCVRVQKDALAEPDVVVASSWGAAVALKLLVDRVWTGPTVLLCPGHRRLLSLCRRWPLVVFPAAGYSLSLTRSRQAVLILRRNRVHHPAWTCDRSAGCVPCPLLRNPRLPHESRGAGQRLQLQPRPQLLSKGASTGRCFGGHGAGLRPPCSR